MQLNGDAVASGHDSVAGIRLVDLAVMLLAISLLLLIDGRLGVCRYFTQYHPLQSESPDTFQ